MQWQIEYGSQPESPAEIEITPTAVYLRRGIAQTETGWEYEECKLTPEEYTEYVKETSGPLAELTAQEFNDLAASQELADITAELNHEEQMQLLNDIQADINMGEE